MHKDENRMSHPPTTSDAAQPLLPEEEDVVEGESPTEAVPAGGAGADSGAADVVRVDPDDEASIPDVSTHNKEPGVGTRDARHHGRDI